MRPLYEGFAHVLNDLGYIEGRNVRTFASVLLQQGQSAVYGQRQLDHASIKLTIDTYGKWLPMGTRLP